MESEGGNEGVFAPPDTPPVPPPEAAGGWEQGVPPFTPSMEEGKGRVAEPADASEPEQWGEEEPLPFGEGEAPPPPSWENGEGMEL